MRLFTGGPGRKKGIPVHPLSHDTHSNYGKLLSKGNTCILCLNYETEECYRISIDYISYLDMDIVMTNQKLTIRRLITRTFIYVWWDIIEGYNL